MSVKRYAHDIKRLNLRSGVVLEIGSRDAKDAMLIAKILGVSSKNIHVVEPNPDLHSLIKNTYPGINLHTCAINNKEGLSNFNKIISDNLNVVGQSSLLDRTDDAYSTTKTEVITVECIKGSTLLKKINKPVTACKIDVEGLTYEVLESFGESINQIESFHLETENIEFWKDQKLEDDLFKFMIEKNYRLIFKDCPYATQCDSVWVKNF